MILPHETPEDDWLCLDCAWAGSGDDLKSFTFRPTGQHAVKQLFICPVCYSARIMVEDKEYLEEP